MVARLALGRWQDTLPGTYDPSRAVVVTDPPFGLRGRGAGGGRRGSVGDERDRLARGYVDEVPWREHVAEVLDRLPAVRHVIRGPATILGSPHPPARRYCAEVARFRRTMFRPNVVDYAFQVWAVYGSLTVERRRRSMPRDVCIVDTRATLSSAPGRSHRGVTPHQAALWAIDTWAPRGWVVLDPFAGTGTIGHAALELGCDYAGAEVEPRWHAAAMTRLNHTPSRLWPVGDEP